MSEKDLQNAVRDFIRFHGGYCAKVLCGRFPCYNGQGVKPTSFAHGADRGTPDLLVCLDGRFFGIECKVSERVAAAWETSNTETAKAQAYQQRLIRKSGGVTMVVGSIKMLEDSLKRAGVNL